MIRRRLLLGSLLLASMTVLPLGLLVRAEWDPLLSWDNSAVEALVQPSGWGRAVALALTQLGAPLLLELIAVVIAVTLSRPGASVVRREPTPGPSVVRSRPSLGPSVVRRSPRSGVFVLVSVLGAQVVSRLSQDLIDRVRPCVDLAGCPNRPSFPSGHSVVATAFWTTVVVLLLPIVGRRAWWLLGIPPVVALTRVLLGVHYPSDVIAGLFVGGCWAVAWAAILAPWRDESPAVAGPAVAGAGEEVVG